MVLTNALWITLIGMGLVFFSILLLWGLMVLLVRVLPVHEKRAAEPARAGADPKQSAIPEDSLLLARKRRAAAVAVAAAMAMAEDMGKQSSAGRAQQSPGVSVWQAVNRSRQISQRGYSSRKKVVR